MQNEKLNHQQACKAVAKMSEQLATLKMQMPMALAFALQATATRLDAVQIELDNWGEAIRKEALDNHEQPLYDEPRRSVAATSEQSELSG